MKVPFPELHGLEDAQRNFEALQSQALYSGNGAPAFKPSESRAFYFRFDTPGTANQRLYVFNGTTWAGIL